MDGKVVRTGAAVVAGVLACVALAGTADKLGTGSATGTALASIDLGVEDGPDGVDRTPGRFGVLGVLPADNTLLDAAAAQRSADEAHRAEQLRIEAEAAWLANNPPPVAGLNQAQMNNALRIVQAGQALGLPKRAYVIAVATAMQESNLYNLASTRIAESYQYWHEGSGSDHDSVGLFQQRASSGWGRVQHLMDPHYAAVAFYRALMRVPGWESMPLTRAAQKVQVSAYPNAYAKHEGRAQAVVDALVPLP